MDIFISSTPLPVLSHHLPNSSFFRSFFCYFGFILSRLIIYFGKCIFASFFPFFSLSFYYIIFFILSSYIRFFLPCGFYYNYFLFFTEFTFFLLSLVLNFVLILFLILKSTSNIFLKYVAVLLIKWNKLVGWVLWLINLCRLFNAKYILCK